MLTLTQLETRENPSDLPLSPMDYAPMPTLSVVATVIAATVPGVQVGAYPLEPTQADTVPPLPSYTPPTQTLQSEVLPPTPAPFPSSSPVAQIITAATLGAAPLPYAYPTLPPVGLQTTLPLQSEVLPPFPSYVP